MPDTRDRYTIEEANVIGYDGWCVVDRQEPHREIMRSTHRESVEKKCRELNEQNRESFPWEES